VNINEIGVIVILNSKDEIIRIVAGIKGNTTLNSAPKELNSLQSLIILPHFRRDELKPKKSEQLLRLSISPEVKELKSLESFACVRMTVFIPFELFFLDSIKSTFIRDVKGELMPPNKIMDQGLLAIRNFYLELESSNELDYLYEAKMVLVGRGFVGKTTIIKKLISRSYDLIDDLESTEGIDISEWRMPIQLENSGTFKFNIWDFGGQEKYDATHQFFITERTLYLFVTESRQESNYLDFDYWLNIVEMLGDGSPLIVIQNKIDQRSKQLPSDRYGALFKNIKAFVNVSCKKGYENTLIDLEDQIKLAVKQLPQVGDELPKAWVEIRKHLEELDKDYISYSDYFNVCKDFKLNKKRADFLDRYFHDLGIILHVTKDPILKKLVILNPDWLVDGVYSVLDNRKIEEKSGRFNYEDLNDIWEESKYENKQAELVALMVNYGICFKLSNNEFIAPELLSPNKPFNFIPISKQNRLTFIYQYDFMPAGLLSRLFVKIHKYLYEDMFWKHGMIVHMNNTEAMIVEDEIQKIIRIDIAGVGDKRDTLAILRKELAEIYVDFNQKIKYDELIPCNCNFCLNRNNDPHFFRWNTVKLFKDKKRSSIPCEKSTEDVSVDSLIGEITDFSRQNSGLSSLQLIQVEKEHHVIESTSRKKLENDDSLWWKKSILAGFIVGLVVFLLLIIPSEYNNVRFAIIISFFITGLFLMRNPKTRYMRAFWGVFSGWNLLNLFPAMQLSMHSKSDSSHAKSESIFEFVTFNTDVIVNFSLVILMIFLLYFDFKERKQ
ncbi:MAG: GTP-binding protein, partial [Algicola sp.]|nr:GTP-binding protein [Algicola sp.]